MSYRQCTKCGKMAELRKYYRTCDECLAKAKERKMAKQKAKKVVRHICGDCGNWVLESKYDLQKQKCLRCAAKYVWHDKKYKKKYTKCKHCGKLMIGNRKYCPVCRDFISAKYVVLKYQANDDYVIGKLLDDYPEHINILPFDCKGKLLDEVLHLNKSLFEPDSVNPLSRQKFKEVFARL